VAFVLVGSGAEKEHLIDLAKKLELSNVYFLPPVSHSAVVALFERMDVLFIGWKNRPIYRYGVSPNKLMDYMLSSRPILHANGVGNDIVAECGCGISVPPEDPEAIARAVRRFMQMDEETRSAIGRKGKACLLQKYQNKDLARKFIERCSAVALGM
jgi:glycosyltransferase involved in cell wall biosynthesis